MYERINTFIPKETVTTTLAVLKKETRTTKTGNSYLHLGLTDKTGKITAKIWEEEKSSVPWKDLSIGKVYLFTGKIEKYQETLQMIIEDVHEVSSYEKTDFIATIEENIEDLKKELNEYIASLENTYLQTLINNYLDRDNTEEKFYEAPAAKSVHDATLGGLLRHTTRLIRLSLTVQKMYPEIQVDRNLLITGCVLHDIEKISEYSWDTATIEYTDEGHYIGHCSMAMMKVYHEIQKIDGFPKDLENRLIHMIAAHAAEYDPVRLPSIPEALILHLCDLTDSQIVHFKQEWDIHRGEGWEKDYLTKRWQYYPDK